ncbi:DUF2062 domain-containing protein [Hymenobacter sp. RP-2-7]|uniref:DUF2062 domain-containing protein n=1 Tax=Hymenobacter polaris TaxID=2682546 RepID=A0A7Y0AB05_9BACT|nr:DUF2062 domain-containing protein [Hymenobacter polaris]NML64012.1 DUF2062 domain-containing protein [Hymenobacter polaris]
MPTTSISSAGASTEPTPPPRTWVQRHLLDPFLSLLKAGLSPGSLALTVGLGVALGVGPTLGFTTALAVAVALRLRLNVAAMQLVVHLLSPVQLLLLLPLLRYGAALLGHGAAVANLTLAQIEFMLKNDLGQLWRLLWRAELGALVLWLLGSVPLVAACYFGLKPLFKRVLARQQAGVVRDVVIEPAE